MSPFPKQIAWTEPWSVEYVKERLRQCRKELPSLWRMAAYCVVLPTVVMFVAKAFLPTLEWSRVLRVILGLPVAFITLPFLISVFPTCIHIFASGVTFQVGNASSHIAMKNITALSFETHDGKRYLVVHATSPKGIPYERRALLPPRNVAKPGIVTEQDIIGFLYEMNLGHLVKETRENANIKKDDSAPT